MIIIRYLLSIVVASLAIFGLLRLVPGDPARIALGVTADDASVAALAHTLGTDRPLIQQYFSWIGGLLTGDFGMSLATRSNATAMILDRAQVSLILCFCATVLALLIALPLGFWAARRANHPVGTVISILTQVGIAVPSFLAAVLLVALFAVRLDWLPSSGWVPPGYDFSAFVQRLVLPVVALALVQGSILTRYVRSALLDVLSEDHIRTARAIGQSEKQALTRHGLKSAALPLLTIVGVQLSSLIVGAVVVEQVFMLPGLGSLLLTSVTNRDLPVVQTVVMLIVLFTLTVNLVVDASYRFLDPRLRTSGVAR
ncbi:ABC transporter permease [Corynebacterium tapiri]|uniref:ABC transporter permease n=1 Tax=Corynebacterium tapiri TaxID=1448266 RepID=A0A5C4U402_9CORY|nr:ABC transporter permease [Corynebacterium tapiri]TNL96613.1 ABC transporter permease [Corynebacterium tapiri]